MLLLLACTSADPSLGGDGQRNDADAEVVPAVDRWFDPDRILEVALTLDPTDWDTLRYQTRSIYELLTGECLAEPFASPFTWFDADISVDGAVRSGVQVRKKGLIGSMSTTRPSLKVDFVDGALDGVEHLTLNGAPQDPTMLRTCLAYAVYASAGVPAPRCSFAHLTVNGEDLGVYANVETLDDRFLDRAFGGHDGELFEGTLSDFREGWLGTFDPDTENADTAHLEPVVEALSGPDATLYDALEPVVDLEAFHRFWASEVLIGQWDGYTSNTNNFYVYLDTDGRIRFLPWGPDGAFSTLEPFGAGAPTWEVANAQLPWRLLQTEEGEVRHRAALVGLLDDVWDGPALVAEADRMADLVAPYWSVDRPARNTLEAVLDGTEASLRASLAKDAPVWPDALRAPPCLVEIGTIDAAFRTTWDSWATQDAWTYGDASMTLVWDGSAIPAPDGSCIAGDDGTGYAGVLPILTVGDAVLIPYLSLSPYALIPGEVALDGASGSATLYYSDPSTNGQFVAIGYIGGVVSLDEAGTAAGDTVSGALVGTVYVAGG